MDAPRFVAVVSARRGLVVATVVVAAALASLASLLQSPDYRASATLWFGPATTPEEVFPGDTRGPATRPERVAATNLALASLDTVAARVKRRFPGDGTLEELRAAVSVQPEGASDVARVTARAGSAREAAALANAFADEIVALRRDTARADLQQAIDALQAALRARAATGRRRDAGTRALERRLVELGVIKGLQTGDVQLAERAVPPRSTISPSPGRNIAIAVFVALVFGLLLVTVLSGSEDRVRDEEELALMIGAPVLARVPRVGRPSRRRDVWSTRRHERFLEAFEFLRTNVELLRPEGDSLVVAVTSPTAADGKTTAAAWLTRAWATTGANVAALDLDTRDPGLRARLMGADRRSGELASPSNVHVITTGDNPYLTQAVHSTARLERFFDGVREWADVVVVDTPPLSLVADATAAAAAADAVVVVVDISRARRRDVLAAKRQLTNPNVNVLGVVVNRAARFHAPLAEELLELERAPTAVARH
jgi:Mrp family chromosome partitioning ATPase/capsular polysaccharide biosynthesis protein